MRHPGETISQFAVRVAWETGHFWSPENPEGTGVKQTDLAILKPDDPVVVSAMISMSRMDASRYTRHVLDQHGRVPNFDGEIGPAIEAMVSEPFGRCPVPDYAPPPGVSFQFDDPDLQAVVERMQRNTAEATAEAIASGGWPNCHGVNGIHCMAIRVNLAGINPKYAHLWTKIMRNVQKANCEIGLFIRFIGMDGKDLLTGEPWTSNINSELSFVQSSTGWIGLAIVGQNEGCSSKIWLKLLATYVGGTADLIIEQQITALLQHELGHNMGLGHSNGGIMNPSITQGNPVGQWPSNDPSRPRLVSLFSGVPVPIPGGGPLPPGPPGPPNTIEKQLFDLRVTNAVQDVTLQWCVAKIKALGK